MLALPPTQQNPRLRSSHLGRRLALPPTPQRHLHLRLIPPWAPLPDKALQHKAVIIKRAPLNWTSLWTGRHHRAVGVLAVVLVALLFFVRPCVHAARGRYAQPKLSFQLDGNNPSPAEESPRLRFLLETPRLRFVLVPPSSDPCWLRVPATRACPWA